MLYQTALKNLLMAQAKLPVKQHVFAIKRHFRSINFNRVFIVYKVLLMIIDSLRDMKNQGD